MLGQKQVARALARFTRVVSSFDGHPRFKKQPSPSPSSGTPSTVFTNLRYPLRKVTSLADRPIVQLLLDRPLPLMLPTAA